PVLWGVSRVSNSYPDGNVITPSHNRCNPGVAALPPNDVKICNGQMVESLDDGGAVANLDTYPKQPFDFTGRTGTVVFDVSADSEGIHAAWPEFVITDTPVPGTRGAISVPETQHAANEIGFELSGCGGSLGALTGVSTVYWAVNGTYHEADAGGGACV